MLLKTAASLLTLASAALAHMEIINPCPRYSPHCATTPTLPPGESIDYNMNTPIGSNGSILAPFCRRTTPWPKVTDTWTAGQAVTVQFYPGGATHSGGHCEFSLSYDGGKTFVVVHQALKYCFFTGAPSAGGVDTVRSYTINLPANLPGTDRAVFAWTWVNAAGNREFYNGCGDIAIKGSAGSYTGKKVTIANYGPGYPVIPEFLGNYNTGLEYYTTNTTAVTVTGPGYNGGSGTTTSPAATTTTSAAPTSSAPPVTSTTKVATTTAPSTSAVPTTSAAPGSCTDYTYQCTSDKTGYQVCLSGAWSSTLACASGTTCVQNGSSVYCGWA